ncbi:unnamed protein product, partial [Vitis vinifera]
MNHLTVVTEDAFASLLELAANNDFGRFKQSIEREPSGVDEIGQWYGRQKGSKQMVLEYRTPLMVAATYGSIDVMKLILSLSDSDVNRFCGLDKSTALHCAASGGSVNAVDVVKLLLLVGADPNSLDANGHRPVDVLVVPPKLQDLNDLPISCASEKKEYPVDPSLPDIKNSIYATDEFRMFSFKVRPCSRAYSHDWTECPFVHPGENARRRDPRKFHYSCVPCPDFRKGACRRGDMCEYAHGVFECWLHPAQYRTRLCKDGTNCNRRVCFFAHTTEELRPLYMSTGSAVPSPRPSSSTATAMDFATAMNLIPGSPSSVSVMSPSPFTPPLSPSANGVSHSSMGWAQPNVPTLHLPGSNLQSSRLRSSLNARDIPAEDINLMLDFDIQQHQLLNELSCLSQPCVNSNSLNRSGRSKTLTPSNLDELFSAESSSPRYSDQALASAVYSPTHKSAVLNQFQQQQSMMSPRSMEPISPMSSRASMFAQREKQQQQQFRSLSSRDLGSNSSAIVGSPINSWSKWGSSNVKPDWAMNANELGGHRRSNSFELGNNGEEPDLSWVQSLVKESPTETKEKAATPALDTAEASSSSDGSNLNSQIESIDHAVLGAWLEQMQLDQLVAQ